MILEYEIKEEFQAAFKLEVEAFKKVIEEDGIFPEIRLDGDTIEFPDEYLRDSHGFYTDEGRLIVAIWEEFSVSVSSILLDSTEGVEEIPYIISMRASKKVNNNIRLEDNKIKIYGLGRTQKAEFTQIVNLVDPDIKVDYGEPMVMNVGKVEKIVSHTIYHTLETARDLLSNKDIVDIVKEEINESK